MSQDPAPPAPSTPGWRIGIGGIAIESSTFSPLPSTLADFTIRRGQDMLARYPFMPGWDFRGRADVTWLPCLHAGAIPGGPVTADAYAAMKAELLERIRAALPLDGFYLTSTAPCRCWALTTPRVTWRPISARSWGRAA